MKLIAHILFTILLLDACRPNQDNTVTQFVGKPEVPASIKKEHEYLLSEVTKLTAFKDSTGNIAIRLKELMQHHFKEEEDYALPPLAYLPLLAAGNTLPQSDQVISLTEKLKAQVVHMNVEHQLIKAHLKELVLAADRESHPGVTALEKEISKHAATEEEILFPAAIVIGDYLKLKSDRK